jgi:hypothetical protein
MVQTIHVSSTSTRRITTFQNPDYGVAAMLMHFMHACSSGLSPRVELCSERLTIQKGTLLR